MFMSLLASLTLPASIDSFTELIAKPVLCSKLGNIESGPGNEINIVGLVLYSPMRGSICVAVEHPNSSKKVFKRTHTWNSPHILALFPKDLATLKIHGVPQCNLSAFSHRFSQKPGLSEKLDLFSITLSNSNCPNGEHFPSLRRWSLS